jgi:hypothetical protein
VLSTEMRSGMPNEIYDVGVFPKSGEHRAQSTESWDEGPVPSRNETAKVTEPEVESGRYASRLGEWHIMKDRT